MLGLRLVQAGVRGDISARRRQGRVRAMDQGEGIMSLREDLTRRFEELAEVYASTEGAPTPDALRMVYANECIRQMEWARREERELSGNLLPTLAPEDWKP